jgi:hypothetical protein
VADKVTARPLELDLTLVDAERRISVIHSGDVLDLSADLDQGLLRYSLSAGGPARTVSLQSVAQWLDAQWTLRIPFYACVTVALQSDASSADDSPGSLLLLPDFGPFLEEYGRGAPAGVPVLPVQDMTFSGKALWFYSSGSLKPVGEVDSPAKDHATILHSAAGAHVVGWTNAHGDSAFAPIVLLPGESVSLLLHAHRRPVMRGVLIDWTGDPVAHAPIAFVTSLDLVDFDFLPADPHAVVTYERDGTYY